MPANLETLEEKSNFIDSVDNFLLDCDGVLWGGNNVLPGVVDTLQKLREKGKRIFFITNNAGSSREQYVQKFTERGIQATKNEVFNSGFAAATYLKNKNIPGKYSVYVVGTEGLCTELREALGENANIVTTDPTKPFAPAVFGEEYGGENFKKIQDMNFKAVVSGYDTTFNMTRLAWASMILGGVPDCEFVACNTDAQIPVGTDLCVPGNGTVVAAIQTSTGREPTVTGKPKPLLLDLLVQQEGLDRAKTVMVGDRLETDILFGNSGGLRTVFVLTGSSTLDQMESFESKPTFVLSAFGDLFKK